MKLSEDAVKEFIEILKDDYGQTLKYDEAEIMATKLIKFMKVIFYK